MPKHCANTTDKKVAPRIAIHWVPYNVTDVREVMKKDKAIASAPPKSVDEAAELLLSDLLMQHLQTLSNMSEEDFDLLCERVTPYLIEEFKLWEGNDDLLDSCFSKPEIRETDPARIILNRVKQLLIDFHGFLVIT
jgi:hypothetical protein